MLSFKQFLLELEHPMISISGVMRHINNSEGIPIHSTEEGIKNFYKWFGNSKAVDKHGRPKVVYHSTENNWNEYDKSKEKDSAAHGKGLYVAMDKPWDSKRPPMKLYIKTHFPLDSTRPPTDEELLDHDKKFSKYLGRIHNTKESGIPFMSIEKRGGSVVNGLRDVGFDSFIHPGPGSHGKHMVVFDGNKQAKSADVNNGNFNSNSNNINE